MTAPPIQVFLGTKAQYIKTAPLLRLMDARGVDYRLIDSGQHGVLSVRLRDELDVRIPDVVLGVGRDVESIPYAIRWAARIAARLGDVEELRHEVFGGARGGVCVVHGDTPSTLLAAMLARRVGLDVAHLEAGLRSHHLLHPFPEELIRVMVMRLSALLFAPDDEACANLVRMRADGRIVRLPANTIVEALAHDLGEDPPARGSGEVVVTMHRVENLNRRRRVHRLVDLALRVAETRPVVFVVHGPTRDTLARHGEGARLEAAGVRTTELLPHREFVRLLHAAPMVITDGGSIQEEAALLGVPTLLWREWTERPDGLGDNVVLSRYDPDTVAAFLAEPEAWRRPAKLPDAAPSETILEHLLAWSGGAAARPARAQAG